MTKKQDNQLSFSDKIMIFDMENKQTGQLIFSFLVTLTKKRKMKNEMNRTIHSKDPECLGTLVNFSKNPYYVHPKLKKHSS
jgi:hypothetical protein